MDDFTTAIRAKIDSEGISISELSRRSGVSRVFLSHIFNGRQCPSLPIAEKIAESLGMTLKVLEKNG